MKFRPCIDIHQGKVKQIIGSTLRDSGAAENFVADKESSFYARMFRQDRLTGGHIIMLDQSAETRSAAEEALAAYPGGMQIGGGMNGDNCKKYLNAGASHIIVTSFIFSYGIINFGNLKKLCDICGRERIVLDLSCKQMPDGRYRIATDRWQKLSDTELSEGFLEELSGYCDEYLVHAVNAEGKKAGIDEELTKLLSSSPLPVTYAGGISGTEDIEKIRRLGKGTVDFTVGSALDLFGGHIKYEEIKRYNDLHTDAESRS
jgi:phosphoribosylformimino-5-aminoimidazole carboxamide ribotide isomerase